MGICPIALRQLMPHSGKDKENILKRLKIIEGHLGTVVSMIENERYCVEVLQQISAVRSALKKTQDLILSRHLQTCVLSAMKKEEGQRVVTELMNIYTQSK